MPKKHRNIYTVKPQSTAHPSLSSTKNEVSNKPDTTPSSVNDLLSNLRQADKSQNDGSNVLLAQPPTMHPSVRRLFQVPDTPAPRPRMPRRTDANGHRLPAGPAPPSSWLTPSRSVSTAPRRTRDRAHPKDVMHLPGVANPPHGLVDLCLKKMAQDWSFQSHYNTYYLSSMPTRLRVLLLSYIAVYGPDEGVGVQGLENIIRPLLGANTEDNYTGNDDFQRLDVSCAIGRSISFSQLSGSIIPPQEELSKDAWDIDAASTLRSNPTTFLPFLTHLSLSHPPSNISWPKFLNFAKNVPTITHLSLAHWPVPSLTPNSKTATMNSRYGSSVQYGGVNYYSHSIDGDWSEAAGILRRLSWTLYNLEWLNIDGCTEWASALYETSGVNWREHWGKVGLISLKSSLDFGSPERLRETMSLSVQHPLSEQEFVLYKEAILKAVTVETHIRRARGWITVEHDDWEKYDDLISIGHSQMAAKMKMQKWEEMMQTARFSRHNGSKIAGRSIISDESHSTFWH